MGKLLALKTGPAVRAALIDEAGEIKLKIAAFRATGIEAREKQLSEEFASWYSDRPADEEYLERGQRFQLAISARRNVTVIAVADVYRKLGIKRFLKIAALTLKSLGEMLSETEIAEVVTVDRTGSRSFSTTPIARPAPPDARAVSDALLDEVA